MTCPALDELLSGGAAEHVGACASCRAVLERAAARAPLDGCALAEVLLAARVLGELPLESSRLLLRHLQRCNACARVARELEGPAAAHAFSESVVPELDFAELSVVASDNYIRGQEIGRGGMGHIVRARDRRLGRAVAIKELIDERMRARFEQEARLTARLQHPAIVSVYEAGCWQDGEPFYAMKYVAGRPLDQVVASTPTFDERLGLLANLTTVVDAIAYAHSERVLHRDLKPHNILVGPFGETVVIDWGLAKDLRTEPEGDHIYRGAAGALTESGAGTPAYMPPEQARGEEPDERVDVYALGATLHHVLAGDRPDLRPLPEATPPDLRAIISKAMAPDKADRYPSAAELAGELRRFQNGQRVAAHRYTTGELVRRWLGRHRGIVIVASAAVLLLAATAFVSIGRIVTERDRAEGQRRAAERLVDYLVGSLRDRLEPIGRLDLLADTGAEVERYFASMPVASETDVEVLRQRGRAAEILAWVARDKGRLDDAIAGFERTRQLCERRDRLAPTKDSAVCVAQALGQLGQMESGRGDETAALEHFRQQRELLEAALIRFPKDASLRTLRADAQYALGRAYENHDDRARGREAFLLGIQLAEEIVRDHPGGVDAIGELAALRTDLCNLELEDGRPDESIRQCQLAAELRDRQRALDPDSGVYEVWGSTAMSLSAGASTQIGDFGQARAKLEPATALLRKRVEQDPDNALWRSYLASYEMMTCENELARGHASEGERACRAAEMELELLLQKDSEHEIGAQNLASVDSSLAAAYLAQRELEEARGAASKAVRIAAEWNVKQPGNRTWLIVLSDAEWRRATVAVAGGERDDARAAAHAAYAAVIGIVASGAFDVQAELALARAALVIADLDAAAGLTKAAEAGCRRALVSLAAAVARWPRVVELQALLASAKVRLAELMDGTEEARRLRQQAVLLLEPLVQRGALAHEFRGLLERASR